MRNQFGIKRTSFFVALIAVSCICCSVDASVDSSLIWDLVKEGKYQEAEEKINRELELSPNSTKDLILKGDILISAGKFRQAELSFSRVLEIEPENEEALLKLARIKSWASKFAKAAELYERLIILRPTEPLYPIEKARVYAWAGQMDKAEKEYRTAANQFNLQWVRNEMDGKKYLFRGQVDEAIKCYERSLVENPDNQEVLFDLAQFYSNIGRYNKAEKYYEILAVKFPNNTAALKSRKKNTLSERSLTFSPGYNYWDALSPERMTDINQSVTYINIGKKISENIEIGGGYSKTEYSASQKQSMAEDAAFMSFNFTKALEFGLSGRWQIKRNPVDSREGDGYRFDFWYKAPFNTDISVGAGKEFISNNLENVSNLLAAYPLSVSFNTQLNRKFSVFMRLIDADLTDGNNYNNLGASIDLSILSQPFSLLARFSFNRLDYQNSSLNYFAPRNYFDSAAEIIFRHDLGREGFYYGAKRFFYQLKAKTVRDSNNQDSFQCGIELNCDILQNFVCRTGLNLTDSLFYSDKSFFTRLDYIVK